MSRRILLISFVLSLLLLSSLILLNTKAQAQSATATRTSTVIGPTKTPTAASTATPTLTGGPLGWQTISGTVRNISGVPIAGAIVSCTEFAWISTAKCSGSRTTAADGTYSFGQVYLYAIDFISIHVAAAGYAPQIIQRSGSEAFANPVFNFDLSVTTNALTPTPSCETALYTLYGRVYDAATGQGLANATVWTTTDIGAAPNTTTNAAGTYSMVIDNSYHGCHIHGMSAWADGYQQVNLPGDWQDWISQPNRDFALVRSGTPTATYTLTPAIVNTPTRTPAPADFSGTPLSGNAPLTVSFTHNLGSVLPPGLVTCTWTFGDGQSQQFIDTCFNTNHTYTSAGAYTVSLQYSSAGGGSGTVTKPNYISVLSGPTSTITRTPTRTPTGVVTTPPPPVTLTPTRTLTPTSSVGVCSPVTSTITIPFTFDGAGTFCWQASSLGAFVNSWNTTNVSINGVNVTNIWVGSGSYPAKIGGFYYVSYTSSVAFGHFEAKP